MTRPTPSPLPEQLRGLLDIGRALRSGGDLGSVLTAIAAGLLRATEFRAARILEHADLRDIASWVLAHHERIDGGGYPRGLASGDEIAIEARIVAVADAYEAMTADRPYRHALPAAVARGQLQDGEGTRSTRPWSPRSWRCSTPPGPLRRSPPRRSPPPD